MATRKKKTATPKANVRIRLIESDTATPTIQAQPGTRIELVEIADAQGKASRMGSRLCGYGSGYCLAIVSVD